MVMATNLGFPRIGRQRRLKRALEQYWAGIISAHELLMTARELRQEHWRLQRDAGVMHVPCNDFSLYDHVLDTAVMVGAVPARFTAPGTELDRYFAMARGGHSQDGQPGPVALEMTKWFDTNYHYLVPEFARGQTFSLASRKPVEEFAEAQVAGLPVRPVLLGPVSFLLLGKAKEPGFEPLDLWPGLVPVYEEVLRRLAAAGAEWVQIDEPCLVGDPDARALRVLEQTYAQLAAAAPRVRLLLATYFGSLGAALPTVLRLPVKAVHLDLVRGEEQLDRALALAPAGLALSLGLVDGRNIWRTELAAALEQAEKAAACLGAERLMIGPSCSLLHVPLDVDEETDLDPEVRTWLAFARQKLDEVVIIARGIAEGRSAIADAIAANGAAFASRRGSPRTRDPEVQQRLRQITPAMLERSSPHTVRRAAQQARIPLPLLPTTTIGSLPQTEDVRKARAAYRAGKMSAGDYEAFLRSKTEQAIRWQEATGLDVLVHGEFERNDMVEYFGEQLVGFAFTSNGWVQSYGSRCVKPPILFGDVRRRGPMTVGWAMYAQSLTDRPVKGMLTGPITILQWSFVRDDQPRRDTCWQIALALRDEIADLEAAGIAVIQVDEPALREGLPLRPSEQADYLRWAVDAFRLTTAGVRDATQIHTHMCYGEFNDIVPSIAALDADVISIEASRSQMELLAAFAEFRYPNEIGPGVYDIHSPRVPTRREIEHLLDKALAVLSPDQLWVNPDCGLKTRRWDEVKPALVALVDAARSVRQRLTVESEGGPVC